MELYVTSTAALHDESKSMLGIIFDIDGTLIAEGKEIHRIIIRPGTIEFLQLLHQRGHALALWTKAHRQWGEAVAKKICEAVHQESNHKCCGTGSNFCRHTFDFVWCGEEKLKRRQQPSHRWLYHSNKDVTLDGLECRWCEAYSRTCQQCSCHYNYRCPCSDVKDLRKVWYSHEDETKRFTKERTLLVENTPQNCIFNYGNAIYFPTFRGCQSSKASSSSIYDAFGKFIIEKLEPSADVRKVKKCSHGSSYHACYEQSWLSINNAIPARTCTIISD
mmetsp:Transcript_4392/g.5041  ORF Transcript_4392/g.5041 Transcript_4392/m.5041 type:complete len:276 (+) Transcript_4392:55-882(+)